MSVALVTGGSAGLGRELVAALADRGWSVVTDGRDAGRLESGRRVDADGRDAGRLESVWREGVVVVPGDVTDAEHRAELRGEVQRLGRLDLLVHNASTLGPMRPLAEASVPQLSEVWRTNVGAPLVLTGELLPFLDGGVLLGISSDAALEHYPTWGLYGASKAALDHVVLTYAAENPGLTAYAVDPGDMRTQMHQDAFPGEDISDRPLPSTVVPHLLALLEQRPPSGRYRAADVPADDTVAVTV